MNITVEGIEILRRSEQSLRELLTRAASTGDYDALISLGEWAKEVASIIAKANEFGPPRTASMAPAADHAKFAVSSAKHTVGGSGEVTLRSATKRGRYPVFMREGEYLVKIGWSKSEKAEYEHKAPKRVVLSLASTLSRIGGSSRRITMEKVLPITDPANGSEVPSYQAYLCLAWFRSVGLVVQHGRQGYSNVRGRDLEPGVEEFWQQLAER